MKNFKFFLKGFLPTLIFAALFWTLLQKNESQLQFFLFFPFLIAAAIFYKINRLMAWGISVVAFIIALPLLFFFFEFLWEIVNFGS